MYFSKFKPYDRRGRSQFKISHIPWLEHITMEHLREKSRKIHCKTKINDPSEPQRKKKQYYVFCDIFGLVREVKQFKNKLKQWLKTALLFFFVSYPNFFWGVTSILILPRKTPNFRFDWMGRFSNFCLKILRGYWIFFNKTLKRLLCL